MRIEITRDPQRIRGLGESWNQLWGQTRGDIFQRHEWFRGWLNGIVGRPDIAPLFVLAWHGPTLAAVMPFEIRRHRGIRTLQWAAQAFTDYCDLLAAPDAGTPVLEDMWNRAMRAGGFDMVHLKQVHPLGLARGLLQALRTGGPRLQDRQERCMRIDSDWPSGEAFFRSLNKKARNNHTRGKRILSELGGEVAFRLYDTAAPPGAMLDEVEALKTAWLQAHHPESPLLDGDQTILRAILDAAWETGMMQVFLLESGGHLAAASINFVYPDRMQAFITSYDPAFERASPGTILILDYAKWAFDRGMRQVDFLRGEEPFKFRMSNAHTMLDEYLGGRTLLGHAAITARSWRAALRPKPRQANAAIPEEAA